ncbi:hypothetical protein [Bordetella genomosp. 9]|uniref:hypothetical protein n=1 Tax=Bordetella genomosp. 9 TaxID=1416803 RepID=UPI0012F8A0A2|nr:hypothetical protein [Bordetella genomosp. 9]
MNITIHWTSGRTYAAATVEHGSTSIELGYLNASERTAMATTLREAADELTPDDTRDQLLEALVSLHAVARVERDDDYGAVANAAAVIAKYTGRAS